MEEEMYRAWSHWVSNGSNAICKPSLLDAFVAGWTAMMNVALEDQRSGGLHPPTQQGMPET